MSELVRGIEKLSPAKRALLLQRLRARQEAKEPARISKRNPEAGDDVPLSFAQQRLWFLSQFEQETPLYALPAAFRLSGPLNVAALEQSLDALMHRHEALRTRIALRDGHPVQMITTDAHLPLSIEKLTASSENEQEAIVQRVTEEEARCPFDLTQGPLVHARLLQLGAEEQVLLVTMHHIISDGWSINIFLRELGTLYTSFRAGLPSPLPDLPIQYADYTLWQQRWLQGPQFQERLTYWSKRLADLPQLALPTDHLRPAMQRFQGCYLRFHLSPRLTEELGALSRREGMTLFMTLLAAFQVLLARYSGQEDIAVGTPIANRISSEVEGLIGFFVNTLVLRTDLSGDPSVYELLGRVREMTLQAYSHQELPFEKLVENLNPERSLSKNPLFQVMFSMQHGLRRPLELNGVQVEPIRIESSTSMFDLTLTLSETPEGLLGGIEYDKDLFEVDTIRRMVGHYEQILNEMVAHPEFRLSFLRPLIQTERDWLNTWNATRAVYPQDACLHELFEAQVQRTPDAVAVVYEYEQVTYQELNMRANQLAHILLKQGVGPEARVGICLERSPMLLVSLLGILKAGGAYLILDPDTPPERHARMLRDAQPSLLLTRRPLLNNLPQSALPQTICLDGHEGELRQGSQSNLTRNTVSQNLAYVLYTSGSTGQPKGILISHQAVVNHTIALTKAYELRETDRVLQFASMSFDVAAEEIFPCWSSGAAVVLRPHSLLLSPDEFLTFIEREQLTVLNLPPAYCQRWVLKLATSGGPCPSSLRLIVVGSDLVLSEHVTLWQKHLRAAIRWINAYGCSETTITSTLYELGNWQDIQGGKVVPIGQPISNVQAFVLNARLSPVPIGVPGELYIAGAGLARGYLNRPELTAERFLPDPFSEQPGARLYKTGDLVRYCPDGNLEFLGRLDQQIKLRGFRIEPGEIESVIMKHPQMQDVAVELCVDRSGERCLVAYVVPAAEGVFSSQHLSTYLQEYLPEYMIPAAFVQLRALPLTVNGKVDRRSLPVPVWENIVHLDTEPTTLHEQILAGIWAEVLGIERVSTQANFFELGGDSILSLLVIARAHQAGLQLTPKQMFHHQTIAGLAAVAQRLTAEEDEDEESAGTVPLLPIQMWFFEQELAEPHYWNQALCLEIPRQRFVPHLLQQALAALVARHDALRLHFTRLTGGWEQCIAAAEIHSSELTRSLDIDALDEALRAHTLSAVVAQAQASLNLENGPLLRALHITRNAPEPPLLLLVIHHLAVDGVSWRILLEDLHHIYDQLLQEKPIHLPPKTTSLKRWSRRLWSHANSPEIQPEAAYWLAQVQQSVPGLPLDFPAELTANTEASRRSVKLSLEAEKTRALLQEVPGIYHTQITEVLLTALLLACAPWVGRPQLLVDLEGHGREALFDGIDISRTVGWFTSMFPLLLNLENLAPPALSQIDLGQVLKAVKEQVRAVPHHGIGYGIVRYLSKDLDARRRLAASPQAQISFNYLGQFHSSQVDAGDSLFRWVQADMGSVTSPENLRSHLLDVNAQVMDGRLQINWSFSAHLHSPGTIEVLAQRYLDTLRSLIEHCRTPGAGGYTPSDFPALGLSQARLDKVIGKLHATQQKAQL